MPVKPYNGKGYTDEQLRQLVREMETDFPLVVARFKAAFKSKTFVYGTSGRQGGPAKLGNIMVNSINEGFKLKDKNGKLREIRAAPEKKVAQIFQAGVRQKVQRENNYQMMDMYYGDKLFGGDLGERADKDILVFVIYATKLRFLPGWERHKPAIWPFELGLPYDHPYDILKAMGVEKGWETCPMTDAAYGDDDWGHLTMSPTKELSRVIRWGVAEYGGTIIFEGAEVYYDQVFSKKFRLADTDLEARVFFQHFAHNQSRASLGNNGGQVIFHWNSKETKPSKILFLTSWQWTQWGAQQWYKINNPDAYNPNVLGHFKGAAPTRINPEAREDQPWTWKYKQGKFGAPVYAGGGGSVPPSAQNAPGRWTAVGRFREAMNKLRTEITYQDLWDNFSDLPQGVKPVQIPQWLDSLNQIGV